MKGKSVIIKSQERSRAGKYTRVSHDGGGLWNTGHKDREKKKRLHVSQFPLFVVHFHFFFLKILLAYDDILSL